jgi:transposase
MVNHIFVGIDLGDKNSVARIAVNRDKTERMTFVNDRRGRARLFEELRRRAENVDEGEIVMAYEASSCGFILRDEAEARGIRCWVLAPTKMEKSVEQRKHKNDDRDADDVVEKLRAHVLAGNRLPTVWVPDAQMRDDRELVRSRMELVEKQTRLKTQIQMLVKRHGLEKPSGCGRGWTVGHRQWLKGLTESDVLGAGARMALQSLLRQLSFLEAEVERVEKPIQQLAQQPRHKPIIDELTQEHGVGLMTAMVYRTEIGYAGRFRRSRRLGKFVGLTPTSHESGQQQDRKGHISRQGPPRLRKMLCQASWVHVQHDPQAKRFYLQLVSRNPKKKKIAIVAVMRRLAVRLWHRMRAAELRMTALVPEMN